MFLAMVKNTMHVLPNLTSTTTLCTSFHLWMSQGEVDMFGLIINVSTSPLDKMKLGCPCMSTLGCVK
jgi:hypothetical protein